MNSMDSKTISNHHFPHCFSHKRNDLKPIFDFSQHSHRQLWTYGTALGCPEWSRRRHATVDCNSVRDGFFDGKNSRKFHEDARNPKNNKQNVRWHIFWTVGVEIAVEEMADSSKVTARCFTVGHWLHKVIWIWSDHLVDQNGHLRSVVLLVVDLQSFVCDQNPSW